MKHSKYKKPIPPGLKYLDVYRVCRIFQVNDSSGAIQHALKKLLCPGQRGVKDRAQDLQEVIDSLKELQVMDDEFAEKAEPAPEKPVGEPVPQKLIDADPAIVKAITDSVAHLVQRGNLDLLLYAPTKKSNYVNVQRQSVKPHQLHDEAMILYQLVDGGPVRIEMAKNMHWSDVMSWRLATCAEGGWVENIGTSPVHIAGLGMQVYNDTFVRVWGVEIAGNQTFINQGKVIGFSWATRCRDGVSLTIRRWRLGDPKLPATL